MEWFSPHISCIFQSITSSVLFEATHLRGVHSAFARRSRGFGRRSRATSEVLRSDSSEVRLVKIDSMNFKCLLTKHLRTYYSCISMYNQYNLEASIVTCGNY